jgi:hypothetical protein
MQFLVSLLPLVLVVSVRGRSVGLRVGSVLGAVQLECGRQIGQFRLRQLEGKRGERSQHAGLALVLSWHEKDWLRPSKCRLTVGNRPAWQLMQHTQRRSRRTSNSTGHRLSITAAR